MMSDQNVEADAVDHPPTAPTPSPHRVKHNHSRDLIPLDAVRAPIADLMIADDPGLGPHSLVSRRDVARYRARYVEELLQEERGELSELDRQVTESLANQDTLSADVEEDYAGRRTLGEQLSDGLAKFGGSWMFLISFTMILVLWMGVNAAVAPDKVFDPFPFILLNLVLSCLAAVQAPIIMMSQKRQEEKDRLRSRNDYLVNLKAELEIRHLHEKIDHLLTRQWERMAELQQMQLELMQDLGARRRK